jgi:hypothetical protein
MRTSIASRSSRETRQARARPYRLLHAPAPGVLELGRLGLSYQADAARRDAALEHLARLGGIQQVGAAEAGEAAFTRARLPGSDRARPRSPS